MSCGEDSTEWSSLVLRLNLNGAAVVADSPSRCAKTGVLDKSGHLAKLGGKLKTWRRRFFVLSNGKLRYWKTQVNNLDYSYYYLMANRFSFKLNHFEYKTIFCFGLNNYCNDCFLIHFLLFHFNVL